MSLEIRFASGLSFPIQLVTQRVAIMGTSGGGKTYGAGVLVEGLIEAGAQVVILDGMGIWYGLRIAKNGKAKGLSIPVFGGEHGDIPLEPTSGALMARHVAEKRLSMVLDVSDMNGAEQRRFVTEFAVALHRLKKANRSPVMVVWEECQDFVPQRVAGDTARMVGAMERLIKQGRNYGIGTMLISQRPQAVNKDVLNQCGVLLAFQTIGAHERKAIKDWVVHNGVEQLAQLNDLPSSPVGTCFVWSPGWLKVFTRVRVLEKRTLDTSKAPEFGDVAVAYELPPVDLDELRKEMAATIEKAKADDPKALRARIAELERALRSRPDPSVERVEVPVLDGNAIVQLRDLVLSMSAAGSLVCESAQGILDAVEKVHAVSARARPDPLSRPAAPPRATPRSTSTGAGSPDVGKSGLRRMLVALAQRPNGLTNRQLGVRAGVSSKSGTFSTYLSRARGAGWIEDRGDVRLITDAGVAALGAFDPLPEGSELADYWIGELGTSGAARMLRALVDAYPRGMSNAELGEAAGVSHASGTFSTYLSRLRSLELVEGRGELRASEELTDGRAA